MTVAVMPVQLSTVWIAVQATHLQEIRGAVPWVALPGASQHLPGVMPWRGRAIAVLDLGELLGLTPPMQVGETRSRTLIVQVADTAFAVPVDAVREVHSVAEVEHSHATQLRMAYGQVVIGGIAMPVVDLSRVLSVIRTGGGAE